MNDYLDRHDRMVKINKFREFSKSPDGYITKLIITLIVIFLIIHWVFEYKEKKRVINIYTPISRTVDCRACHVKVAMTTYFKKIGSKTPEEMAVAVLKTKSPRLLAAMAKVETNGNPRIRRSGYKKRHHGAFQVNPHDWGTVPKDAVGQALQAERIMTELTETMPIKKALSQYGGDSTDRYQNKILAELVNVP